MLTGLCRDCLATTDMQPVASRCPRCGSPRMVAHPEIGSLAIAHVDCDAFYASIEKRDDPSLGEKPIIVGGSRRGVVLTACYQARIFGVRSAMPMFQALKLCPQAIIVRPNMAKYAAVGRAIRAKMGDLTPRVQPVSIDEAFLDLSGTEAVHGKAPAVALAAFAQSIEAELGLTVSVGLSDCKFLAKIASDAEKPRGFTIIGRTDAAAALRPRDVGAIWGVGRVTQAHLVARGFRVIGDIQDCSKAEFVARVGSGGAALWHLAFGEDSRGVSSRRDTKSISSETTFGSDLTSANELHPILYRLAEKVAGRLVDSKLAAGGVVLKLKTRDFRLRTRSRTPIPPTQLAARLFDYARTLLAHELDGTRFRLIGLAASDLRPAVLADQGDLLDVSLERQKATARAIDAVRARHGRDALHRAITFDPGKKG